MKKAKIFLFLMIIFKSCLFPESLELEWFLKFSKLLDSIQVDKDADRTEKVKYHLILMDLGGIEQSLDILKQKGLDFEKYDFIQYICKNTYFKTHLNRNYLDTIRESVLQLDMPVNIVVNHLVTIGYLYRDIGEKDEFKKILDLSVEKLLALKFDAKKNKADDDYYLQLGTIQEIPKCLITIGKAYLDIGERAEMEKTMARAVQKNIAADMDCTNRAISLGHIYEVYKSAEMEDYAETIYKKMTDYQKGCNKKLLANALIFNVYIEIFLDLKEYPRAKIFLEKFIRCLFAEDRFDYLDITFALEKYWEMKDKDKVAEVMNQVIDYCLGVKVNSAAAIEKCVDVFQECRQTSDILKNIEVRPFIEKLTAKRKNTNDNKTIAGINKLLFNFYIPIKDYKEAFRLAKSLEDREPGHERSAYLFALAADMLDNGIETGLKDCSDNIRDMYYEILLYYKIGEHYVKSGRPEEAAVVLNNAFTLIKEFISIDRRYIGGVIYSIIDLYKKTDNTRGLQDIKNFYRDISGTSDRVESNENRVLSRVSASLLEVYLKRKDLDSALKTASQLEPSLDKAIASLYFSKYFLDERNTTEAEKYLDKAFEIMKGFRDGYSFDQFFDAFYKIFLVKTGDDPYKSLFNIE